MQTFFHNLRFYKTYFLSPGQVKYICIIGVKYLLFRAAFKTLQCMNAKLLVFKVEAILNNAELKCVVVSCI